MRILLVNVPHPAIGSRIPDDHLPPLGLLAIGGPLIDAGHEVCLLDADRTNMPFPEIVAVAVAWGPDAVLFGHSGSTSGHPGIAEVARSVHRLMPDVAIVYGGVFPTYHWREILTAEPYVTAIVRGEGEETACRLMAAPESGGSLAGIAGIAYSYGGVPRATRPASVIRDLDAHRIGWELIDFVNYSYWGGLRAVVVQFLRGCPHLCTYCGQRGFWTRWRHRDPIRFARELAWLARVHGVRVINFAAAVLRSRPDPNALRHPAPLDALLSPRSRRRRIIEADQSKWDYKHQVLQTRHMPSWRTLVWFKFTEMVLQCRPKSLWRTFLHPDPALRHAMRWYSRMGRRVWPHEIADFLRGNRLRDGPTLAAFWGAPQDVEEEAMLAERAGRDGQIRPPVSA